MDVRDLLFELDRIPGKDVPVTIDVDGESWDIDLVDIDTNTGGVTIYAVNDAIERVE